MHLGVPTRSVVPTLDGTVLTALLPTAAAELAAAVQRWTGNACHVTCLEPSDLERMRANDEPILRNWAAELLVLVGDGATLGVPT